MTAWLNKIDNDGLAAVAEILHNQSEHFKGRPLPGVVKLRQIPELIERGQIRLNAFWHMLNNSLKNKDYLVGQQLSQADIDAFVVCGFAGWVNEQVPDNCDEIIRWRKMVAEQIA